MSSNNEPLDETTKDIAEIEEQDTEPEAAEENEGTEQDLSLEQQLEAAEAKAAEHWDLLLRSKAELENLRRRGQKDLENAHKYGIEKFVTELLPIKDSLELGLAVEDASAESLREGMELTRNMINSAFEKFSIVEIDPLNEKFDPELHQAMSMQPSEEHEPNTVIAVMQKGYRLNERLVRPAMVMVSRAPE